MRSVPPHDIAETCRAIHQMLILVVDFLEACKSGSKTVVNVVKNFCLAIQNKLCVEFSQRNLEFDEFVIKDYVFEVNGDLEASLK